MATIKQVKRRQNIQMAEGYLDLAMVLDDRWPLDDESREHQESIGTQAVHSVPQRTGDAYRWTVCRCGSVSGAVKQA